MTRRPGLLALAGAAPLVADEPPASAPGDRQGPTLRFGGELGPKDPKFRKGFRSFRLRFGPGDWAGLTIPVASAWGDGQGRDLREWDGGAPIEWSRVSRDGEGDYLASAWMCRGPPNPGWPSSGLS